MQAHAWVICLCFIVAQAAVNEETCSNTQGNSPIDDATCMLQTSARVKDHKGLEQQTPDGGEDASIDDDALIQQVPDGGEDASLDEDRDVAPEDPPALMDFDANSTKEQRYSCSHDNNWGSKIMLHLGLRYSGGGSTHVLQTGWVCSSCWDWGYKTQWWDSNAFQETSYINGLVTTSPTPDCTMHGGFNNWIATFNNHRGDVYVQTHSTDAAFIDAIEVWDAKNTKRMIGQFGGRGWCMSTESGDHHPWSAYGYSSHACYYKLKIPVKGSSTTVWGWRR
jgi:hypothetical protein